MITLEKVKSDIKDLISFPFSPFPNLGFTLIEILVVFTITATISGIGFASFVTYSRSQLLNQTANNIQLLVSQARFNSISVVKTNNDISGNPFSCDIDTPLDGYSVVVNNSNFNDKIDLVQECVDGTIATIKSIMLPTGIVFDNLTTCATIKYNSLSSTTNGASCNIVLNGFNNQKKTILVDATGIASIQ